MFFEDNNTSDSDTKLEYLTFTDFGERSDNLDYLTFVDLRGAFYYRSYSYLILTSIIYLYLSIYCYMFLFIFMYNYILYNNYIQSDIDMLHGQLDIEMPEDGSSPFVFEEKEFIDPSLLFFYDLFGVFITDADDMIIFCNEVFNYDIFYHFIYIKKSSNFFLKLLKLESVNKKNCILNKGDKKFLLNINNSLLINFSEQNLSNLYKNYYNILNNFYTNFNSNKFISLQINLQSQNTAKDNLLRFNKFINKFK